MTTAEMKYEVKDLNLADQGKNQIEWAFKDMPVLKLIQERFIKEQPFKGLKLSACVHVTKETAALCVVMKSGGADAILVASNPLSTQDDVAAALVKHFGIPTFAVAGETPEQYILKRLLNIILISLSTTVAISFQICIQNTLICVQKLSALPKKQQQGLHVCRHLKNKVCFSSLRLV